MKAKVAQYFNEIVSLIVMGLMITALAAGQAAGAVQQTSHAFAEPDDQILLAHLDDADAADPVVVINVDFNFRPQGE